MNIVIITGASSGMGKEFAKQLDEIFPNMDEFWLIARRKEELTKLSYNLNVKTRILPIDLTKDSSYEVLKLLLEENNPTVRMLVNSAGYGLLGDFSDNKIEDEVGMIQCNCIALTKLTHLCIPYMKRNSRIIQLASSAAFLPQPNFSIYAATKSFVLSFSKSLNEELRKKEIYVTAVCPGPVKTEFFDIAEQYGSNMKIKDYIMVDSQAVVRNALVASKRKKTISVYSLPIKSFRVLTKLVPHDLLLKAIRPLHE